MAKSERATCKSSLLPLRHVSTLPVIDICALGPGVARSGRMALREYYLHFTLRMRIMRACMSYRTVVLKI